MNRQSDPAECKVRLLRLPEVLNRVGISRVGLYRRMAVSAFPKPVQLGGNLVGWRSDEIDRWIEDRPRVGELMGGGDV